MHREQPSGDTDPHLQLFPSEDQLASPRSQSESEFVGRNHPLLEGEHGPNVGTRATDVDARGQRTNRMPQRATESRRSSVEAEGHATDVTRVPRKGSHHGARVWTVLLAAAATTSGIGGYLYGRSDARPDADANERAVREARLDETDMSTSGMVGSSTPTGTSEPSTASGGAPPASAVTRPTASSATPTTERSAGGAQAVGEPQAPTAAAARPPTVDVTGDWTLSTVVEASSVSA